MLVENKKYTLDEIWDEIITYSTETEKDGEHYFEVEMCDVANILNKVRLSYTSCIIFDTNISLFCINKNVNTTFVGSQNTHRNSKVNLVASVLYVFLGQYSGEEGVNPPSRIVIFIDELNKYASKETPKNSPILRQVLDVAEYIGFGNFIFKRDRKMGFCIIYSPCFKRVIIVLYTGGILL